MLRLEPMTLSYPRYSPYSATPYGGLFSVPRSVPALAKKYAAEEAAGDPTDWLHQQNSDSVL